MELSRVIEKKVNKINRFLNELLPATGTYPQEIHEAMRYSVFAGGKRFRPVLVMGAAEIVGGDEDLVLPAAAAFELIHTYSLIHDDLPSMDNDNLRRGKPTNHKIFGEAIAILAGDALLTMAWSLIARTACSALIKPDLLLEVIKETSDAAGSQGLIGGQVVDLASEGKTVDKDTLEYIHQCKTGALFRAAVRAGAKLGGGTPEQVEALSDFADFYGLAFQITDDILDLEGKAHKLGKNPGSDLVKKKATYPSFYGLDEAKRMARVNVEKAVENLKIFGPSGDLFRELAYFLLKRDL